MAIYTKKGDRGKSKILNSQFSIFKNEQIFTAIGSIDELNSVLGVCRAYSSDRYFVKLITQIQSNLLVTGSVLAGSKLKIRELVIRELEKEIDKLEKKLPQLTNFILPGGNLLASHLHFARSVCRRVEREVVAFSRTTKVDPLISAYLNRLSDFLFVQARYANYRKKARDIVWKKD
jgi:cob(I)alamin adenosyltransferase